jgi:hypothetical protein
MEKKDLAWLDGEIARLEGQKEEAGNELSDGLTLSVTHIRKDRSWHERELPSCPL